jgi:hypothetical protein
VPFTTATVADWSPLVGLYQKNMATIITTNTIWLVVESVLFRIFSRIDILCLRAGVPI